MLQYKDIKNLSELEKTFVSIHKKAEFFINSIEILKLGKLYPIFLSVKQKGIPAIWLIRIMISFVFIEQSSVYRFISSYWNKYAGFGKDSYYRLKNNPLVNWRALLLGMTKQSLHTIKQRKEANEKGITAFIFDDTTIEKTGKSIEGVSKVWDHVKQIHILGYKLLIMGLYDGTMFIPLDFSLHRERGKNKKKPFGLSLKHYRKQYKKKRDKNTNGYKRKKELDISKIQSMLKMLKNAIKKGVTAQYVLTDSWFTCWEVVETSLNSGLQFIGMFSKVKTKFSYNNKSLTYKDIRRINRTKTKRNKRFGFYYIRTVVEWNGQRVVLYNIKRGKKGNWKTIISTDLKLNFNQTIEIYQIRWTIEVFFKESKQLLNLGKSQSNDFDGQIADFTINMIQYIFLALQNRIDKYTSLGKLFENTKAQAMQIRLHERLVLLLIAIIETLITIFEQLDEEQIIKRIINDQEAFMKIKTILDSSLTLEKAA